MAELSETLTRKIGPLPVWAWAGVGVGGVLVARRLIARQAASTTAPPVGPDVSGGMPTGLGESALPVDVTGRVPTDTTTPDTGGAFFPSLPLAPVETFTPAESVPIGTVTPTPAAEPAPAPTTTTAPTSVAGCSKPHVKPRPGAYPGGRDCPKGWHLNRTPGSPCFGWCIPDVG